MLCSIALMLLCGMFLGWVCKKIHLPSLVGMIATGIFLGPYVLGWIDQSILSISADIRKITLIIILMRAGLTLRLEDLKKVGRPAVLMCFVPACFEILGMVLIAPHFFSLTIQEAAVIGAVVAAVSPAVIVPKMIRLTEEGYGTKKGIPQLILAGASVDDVFVIVLFTAFCGLAKGESVSLQQFVSIPLSILFGAFVGMLIGWILSVYFEKVHIRDTVKTIIMLCIGFFLVTLEDKISGNIPFSGLIAIMGMGILLQFRKKETTVRLSAKFNKLWVGAEIMLFVLVGATVDLHYVTSEGILAVTLIFLVLIFRMVGVWVCLIKTNLTTKERIFCGFGYMPKATVQAAIGGIPLAMGLSCGNLVLAVAVLAILITAPLGAFLIEQSYRKLLTKNKEIV